MKDFAFGVDLGGTTVKMGLFRTTGELLETWEIPTRTENGGALILGDIAASIKDKMAEKEGDLNIRTKAAYALMYCNQNPEAYDQLIQENPAFAAKYEKNEEGKIVKIKKK